MKFHNSVKDHISSDEDVSGFLCCLGEAYELCALYAMPGEEGKNADDIVKMHNKALELFSEARQIYRVLEAKLRSAG